MVTVKKAKRQKIWKQLLSYYLKYILNIFKIFFNLEINLRD